ncbi:mitochondrial import inner membrane translocase subunit TIM50 [Achlya hypogyna]|uniref:Mitochondrial import inner membrane translocase subunit TIM50 n=1 Tax=Achlya hypogyna TaxID=1202772 RepID=A0A1V9ZKD5_ACHHY|nr:mitochondrial import inner membrane translocase subunit TIM50 [Achlya hypogyna]
MLSRMMSTAAVRARGAARLYSTAEVASSKPILREMKALPRETRRKLRLEAENSANPIAKNNKSPVSRLVLRTVFGATGVATAAWHFYLSEATKTEIGQRVDESFVGSIVAWITAQIQEMARPFTKPSRDKLLPDWPMINRGVPEGYPQIPVLILAVEDVLLHSEWDRKFGWRHAKRPHVDEFLETLARYYEIVLFSSEPRMMVEEVLAKLDSKQCAFHYLTREETHFFNGVHVKDLNPMNRPLRKIIVVDHNPENFQLHPANGVTVPAYLDGADRSDRVLKDLIPFFEALGKENVADVTKILSEFADADGIIRDVGPKWNAKLAMLEEKKRQDQAKGFGGFVRGRMPSRPSAPAMSFKN